MQFDDHGKFKYMIFHLGAETYGTPLLGVRKVIENRQAKPVPGTSAAFEGMINLNGDIIGVIDLRKLLGITGGPKALSILVFETDKGFHGGIVDKCLSVTEIKDADIDRKPFTGAGEHVLGIGKVNGELVTLIDLSKAAKLLSASA
jgi:purine-binding chemotaxis protein CheW